MPNATKTVSYPNNTVTFDDNATSENYSIVTIILLPSMILQFVQCEYKQ